VIPIKLQLQIPAGFKEKLENTILEFPPPTGFVFDQALFMAHLINFVPTLDVENNLTNKGYTLLNHEVMRKQGIRSPAVIRRYLEKYNFIKTDNCYIAASSSSDGKSLGYKFTDDSITTYDYVLCEDRNINRKYRERKSEIKAKYLLSHGHLLKWIDKPEFNFEDIVTELYYQYMADEQSGRPKKRRNRKKGKKKKNNKKTSEAKSKVAIKPKKKNWGTIYLETFENYADRKFGINSAIVNRLQQNDFFFNIDPNGNRLHSNYTTMPSFIRPFISYQGKHLAAVDIVNSQPYFSLGLFRKSFWDSKTPFYGVDYSKIIKIYNNQLNNQIIKYLPTLMSDKIVLMLDNEDIKLYTELVSEGRFYEYLLEEIKKSSKPEIQKHAALIKDRNSLKEMVFTVFFSDNRFENNPSNEFFQGSELKDLFRELFPTVFKIFKIIKKGKKNNLSLLLQTVESYSIIETITRKIAKKHKNLFMLTIHDSIVTTAGNEQIVYDIMMEELEKIVGLKPTLKFDPWVIDKTLPSVIYGEKIDREAA
jgi:hypothetical protein